MDIRDGNGTTDETSMSSFGVPKGQRRDRAWFLMVMRLLKRVVIQTTTSQRSGCRSCLFHLKFLPITVKEVWFSHLGLLGQILVRACFNRLSCVALSIWVCLMPKVFHLFSKSHILIDLSL